MARGGTDEKCLRAAVSALRLLGCLYRKYDPLKFNIRDVSECCGGFDTLLDVTYVLCDLIVIPWSQLMSDAEYAPQIPRLQIPQV